jgi:hypothetical protein
LKINKVGTRDGVDLRRAIFFVMSEGKPRKAIIVGFRKRMPPQHLAVLAVKCQKIEFPVIVLGPHDQVSGPVCVEVFHGRPKFNSVFPLRVVPEVGFPANRTGFAR